MSHKILVLLVLLGLVGLMASESLAQEPLKIRSFKADPAAMCAGQSTILSWDVSGAENVTIEPDVYSGEPNGFAEIFPQNNTTYKLTAFSDNVNAVAKLKVVVTDCIAIEKFAVEPEKVCKGSNATVQWKVAGASNVTIDHGIGEVPSTGMMEVTGNESTTYNLTAINGTKNSTANSTLAVDLSCPSINNFEADRPDIIKGSNATLRWNVTNAENVSIDNGIGEVDLSGSMDVSPDSSVIYTLNATNGTNFAISEEIVNVGIKFPEIIDFTASPGLIIRGTESILSWNVTGADYISVDPDIGKVVSNGRKKVIGEENTTYILTAGNASGNVTEISSISITNIAYDFVARAPYAKWSVFSPSYDGRIDFGESDRSTHGFVRYDDAAKTVLKIGPPDQGKIIGDFSEDIKNMGYFIDSRDTFNFWAEMGLSPLANVNIDLKLDIVPLRYYNLYRVPPFGGTAREPIVMNRYAGREPNFSLILDSNGYAYGDHTYFREMKIVRE
jgi:hypothetical protein